MITVVHQGKSYTCAVAIKGPDYIHLLDENGAMCTAFDGVEDFDAYEISGGAWTEPTADHDCFVAVIRDDGSVGKGGHKCSDLLTVADLEQTSEWSDWSVWYENREEVLEAGKTYQVRLELDDGEVLHTAPFEILDSSGEDQTVATFIYKVSGGDLRHGHVFVSPGLAGWSLNGNEVLDDGSLSEVSFTYQYRTVGVGGSGTGGSGAGIPPINAEDTGKVLTANKDGTATWEDLTGGSVEITEVSSPDKITTDLPDGLYIVEGDAENGTGGDTSELAQTVAEHTTQIAGLRETVDDLEDDFIVVRDKVAALEENGTSGGVKIIDLNGEQYALSDTTTLGAYLLSMCLLATDGGHVLDLTEEYPTLIDTILQECDTNQRVMFKSAGTLSNSAISLECALRDKVYIDGTLICVGFSGEVYYGGAILRYSIIFDISSGFLLTKETLAPTT